MALLASDWQSSILQSLAQFLELAENPDAQWRVKRPTTKAYRAAVDLISEVPPAKFSALPLPRIAPDRQGGIQMEWEKGKYAVEISILPNGSIELLKITPSTEEESQCSFDRAKDTILWLSQV
jgi:hypothetical protein